MGTCGTNTVSLLDRIGVGLLLLPCSAPVERCAHFGASDVPNSKEGKTRRTSHAVLVRSPALALRLPVNYGRVRSCAPHGAPKIQSRTGPLRKRRQRWSSPSTLLSHQGCSEAQFTIKRWISVIWRLRHRGGVARGLPRMSKPRGRARDLDSILINSARLALGMFEPQHDQVATPLVGTGTRRMIVRDRHL